MTTHAPRQHHAHQHRPSDCLNQRLHAAPRMQRHGRQACAWHCAGQWLQTTQPVARLLPPGTSRWVAHSSQSAGTTTTTTTTANVTSSSPAPAVQPQQTVKQRSYDLCLQLGITQSTGFRLACSYPDIPTSQLASQTAQLAKQLSIPLEDLCLLASKEPGIITNSPVQLGQTLEILRSLLGELTPTQTSQAILRTPALLSIPPEALLSQFDDLLEALEVERQQLSSLVYMQPYMLTTPVDHIQRRISALADLLHLSSAQTVQLLTAYPPLSLEDPRKLRNRLDDLCALLLADTQQVLDMVGVFPPILMTHPEITGARIQYLADNLDVTTQSLAPLVLKSPALFSTPQNQLVAVFVKLFTYFGEGRSKTEVLELVAQNPTLLGLGPGAAEGASGSGSDSS